MNHSVIEYLLRFTPVKECRAIFNEYTNRVINLNNCTINLEHLSFSTTLRLNNYLNNKNSTLWFKPLQHYLTTTQLTWNSPLIFEIPEFEQLPEPKLQLSQINQSLIEQQPQ